MRNVIIGIVIGVAFGVAAGTAVIAPRLPAGVPSAPRADGADWKPPAGGRTAAGAVMPLPPRVAAKDPYRLKMASAYASSLPQIGTLAKRIESEIWKVSGATFQIKLFEPGALVPPAELFDAVGSGAVDAAFSSPGLWSDKAPALNLFASIPFGPSASEYLAWYYFGGGRREFEALYHDNNIHTLVCGIMAPEAAGWFRKKILVAADLKGLRMRASGLGAKVLAKLGVKTTWVAPDDIFRAFETGAIDATEFSMPAIDQKLGLDRFARNYYFPGWQQPTTLFDLMINLDTWKALTTTQKAQVEAVCGDNVRYGLAEGEALQFGALKSLNGRNVNIRRWPPAILQALESAWKEVAADEIENNRDFARIWKSLSAFRRDYAIWKELGYL